MSQESPQDQPFGPTRIVRALVFWLLFAVSACTKPPVATVVAPGASVLAFGDSVTYGTGAAPGEDWPTRLAESTGWQIVNAGIPGDTAENGRERLGALLDEHRPALVIIEIGGNDFLRHRPAAAVKEDLRSMIRAARATRAQVALVAVPELSLLGAVTGKPKDSPIYRALADEEKVPLIASVFANVLAQPELCADRIHPNANGYRQMASQMHAALTEAGLIGKK